MSLCPCPEMCSMSRMCWGHCSLGRGTKLVYPGQKGIIINIEEPDMNCQSCGSFPCKCEKSEKPYDYMASEPNETDRLAAEYDADQLDTKRSESWDKTSPGEPIHHFTSGASSSGHKPPYECLTPTLLRRSALRMQKGLHYGKHNWKKGSKDKDFVLDRLNHALEHIMLAMQQIDSDTEMSDDDLAAVVVNCMFAMEYQSAMDVRQQQENNLAKRQYIPSIMYGGSAGGGKSLRQEAESNLDKAIASAKGSNKINDFRFHKDLVALLNQHGIDSDMNIADSTLAMMILTELHRWKFNAG